MNQYNRALILTACILGLLFLGLRIIQKNKIQSSSSSIELKEDSSSKVSSVKTTSLKHYEVQEFPIIMGSKKLSAKQIKDHKELYAGYVNKRNEIAQGLQEVDKSKANSTYSAFRALKVSENFARNAAILHELYFENIGTGTKIGVLTQEFIIKDFGSLESFKEDLMATAIAARGWALTCFNLDEHCLQNYLLDSHYEKVPILTIPIIVIDTYEHAYMIDFGINRKEYLALLWDNINWDVIEARLKICISAV